MEFWEINPVHVVAHVGLCCGNQIVPFICYKSRTLGVKSEGKMGGMCLDGALFPKIFFLDFFCF